MPNNKFLNSLSILVPISKLVKAGEGGVSAPKWVAFSRFGKSGCSFWVRIGVLEVEEATGCVGGEHTVRFCENSLAATCVVLVFVFFAFFSFPGVPDTVTWLHKWEGWFQGAELSLDWFGCP